MGANSPYQTLSDIRTAIITDSKETTSTNMVSQVTRWINEGYELLSNRKKRRWLDTQITVQMNAKVEATCTVSSGSNIVTFATGTTFPTGVELQFWNQGYEEVYNVTSSTLNVVTLDQVYLGDSSTSASGIVFQTGTLLPNTVREVFKVYHQHREQPVENVGPQQMRVMQERYGVQNDTAGYFTIFGLSSGSQRVILYPYPDEAYTIYFDVNLMPTPLSLDADEPLVPMKFRQTLYWYGIYKLWLFHRNNEQAAGALQNYNSLAMQMDNEFSPTLDYPHIIPTRRWRSYLRNVTPSFDTRLRDDD